MSRVVLSNLHKHFAAPGWTTRTPRRGAVDGLDLEIHEGEFFVLLGPSGCGKTTTLRCIAGLEDPTEGRIAIGERVVADIGRAIFTPAHRRRIGMMFQSYALWPHMSVFQNVAYPLRHQTGLRDRRDIADAVARALALVDLEGFETRRSTELSGGQQQRVALARALSARPGLLLFDEPLSNLDAQLRARLRQDLRRVHQEAEATSIYVTHDQTEALALADRVAVLNLGRLAQIGPPREVFLSPANRFVAAFVGYENILSGAILAGDGRNAAFRPDGVDAVLPGRRTSGGNRDARGFAAIRAGSLSFSEKRDTRKVSLGAATILDASYQGDGWQVRARVGEAPIQAFARLSDLDGAVPETGAILEVSVAPHDVVILPADEEIPLDQSLAA